MPLENLTGSNVFITNLVPSNPQGTDPVSEGDQHISGTKNVLVNSFPAINGAVTMTPAQLNSIPTLAPLDSPAFIGTPTAPTAAGDTDTTQLATTAFVQAAITGSFSGSGDQLISGSGYQKLPGGLIIQWGEGTTNPVTFPIPFPTACLRVIPQQQSNTSGFNSSFVYVATMTQTNFTRGNTSGGVIYIAIGH